MGASTRPAATTPGDRPRRRWRVDSGDAPAAATAAIPTALAAASLIGRAAAQGGMADVGYRSRAGHSRGGDGCARLDPPRPGAHHHDRDPIGTDLQRQQISGARDDACAAAKSVVAAVYEAGVPLVAALPNRESPEYKAALANEQAVVLVEMEYLRIHTPPATPRDIAEPLTDYINATLAVLAADTSGQDRNLPAQQGQTAMDKAHAACKG